MKTIYKYPVSPAFESIKMPRYAKILCVQVQDNQAFMWAKVDTDNEMEDRSFIIYGTGHEMRDIPHEYIGTFQINGGALVFHLFEVFK